MCGGCLRVDGVYCLRAAFMCWSPMRAGRVKLLFFHQAATLAATVRPVVTRVSTWASSMGRTAWPVALSTWLVSARARQMVRAMVPAVILVFMFVFLSQMLKSNTVHAAADCVRKGGHDAGLGVVGLLRHSGIVVPPGVEVGLHILGGVAAGDAVLALLTSPDGLRPAVLQRLLGLLDVPAQNHVGLAAEIKDLDLSRLLDILLHVVPPFGLSRLPSAAPP